MVGIDEVGRGALAGPVFAGAVWMSPRAMAEFSGKLLDSKSLSVPKREALAREIAEKAVYSLGKADVEEIDRLNILKATLLAMRRAVMALPFVPQAALVDGKHPPVLPCAVQTMVRADQRSLSVAAASIVAKVHRDAFMQRMSVSYPVYGWEKNRGYPVPAHRLALTRFGSCVLHRKSFRPIRDLDSA